MIRRKTPPTVTNESYRRWLRAHRPSWAWFFGLTELEQEQLALIGDEHLQDLIISAGYAIQDPALADASIGAQNGEARGEEVLAKRMVDGLAAQIMARQMAETTQSRLAARRAPAEPTLAGFGARKDAAEQARAQISKKQPRLFGRAPDEASS